MPCYRTTDPHRSRMLTMTTTPTSTHLPLTAVVVAASSIALGAHADTITVCLDGSCDFTDPVAAVNAAAAGDTVQIAAGTYPLAATIVMYGKNLTLRGAVDAQGRPATVLDGQGARSVLSVLSVSNLTKFENLVVTNGRSDYGGGVFLSGADPVFRNCRFTNNTAAWRGGAMLLSSLSHPTLIDCELTGNSAGNTQFPGQGSAGAISIQNNTLTLIGCTVATNSTDGTGSAFLLTSSGTVILESSRVCGNLAPNGVQVHLNGGGGTVVEDLRSCISSDCTSCPTTPACTGDIDWDGAVTGADLGLMLSSWGSCPGCAEDLNHDGTVNGFDLGVLLATWGSCG
jgi:hypothetical protein